jgi:hypothetical protein
MNRPAFKEEKNTNDETHFKLRSSTTFVQKLNLEKCYPTKLSDPD